MSGMCTTARVYLKVGTCASDHFEGPPEAGSPVSIFPLLCSSGGRLKAGHGSVNGGRLAPPELDETGRNGSWQLWLPESSVSISERKRRLLHNFSCRKMRSECTIFPYSIIIAFLGKSSDSGIKIRPAHSSL